MEDISAISAVGSGKQLTPQQKVEVAKLTARDRDVRAHEQAHMASAGALANGIEYDYELGPDGKMYAVGGKVKISIPPGLSAEQKLAASRELHTAAQAPTDPSGQDMVVASQASRMEVEALQEIAKQNAKPAEAKNSVPASQVNHGVKSQTNPRGLDRMA
jgi:hypothetical protein